VDDSRRSPWDRLVESWVGITLAAFVIQGLWFGAVALLAGYKPDWEPALKGTSTGFLSLWTTATVLALGWGGWAAFRPPPDPTSRS